MTEKSIALDRLSVAYDGHEALRDVTGRFVGGSLTAVVGPNGAGKSTLVKTMVGLMRPSSGRIVLDGFTAADIAYLPQAAEIDRSFPVSVADMVMLGGWRTTGAFRAADKALVRRREAALVAVGLEGLGGRPIGSLSVGQFQRVLFARLIVQDRPVIVLDEPFTAVDARSSADLLALVRGWHAEGRTVIAVLHDFDQVRGSFPQAVLLARSLVAWGPTDEVLTPAHLAQAKLAAARWDADGDHEAAAA